MPYGSFPFNVAAGTDVNTNVGFNPLAVIVSNFTPYYIYLPDGLTFIPPWTSGAIVPLSHATQAKATWTLTPFGTQTIPVTPTVYTASLTFTDDPNQGLAGGTQITAPSSTLSNVFTAVPGATITTGTLTYPIVGVRVDNYTGTWYQIGSTGVLVPPFTTGFTMDLIPPATSLVLAPATPPYGLPNNNTGTQVVLTTYASSIGNSPGTTKSFTTNSQTFTASGTFTVPSGVTNVTVFGIGGGGPGGTGGTTNGGGGGGSGGEATYKSFNVTSGSALTVTVGASGANTTIVGLGVNQTWLAGAAGGNSGGQVGANGPNGGGGGGKTTANAGGGGGGGMASAGITSGSGLGGAGGTGSVGFGGGAGSNSNSQGGVGGNGLNNTYAAGGGGGGSTGGAGGTGGGGAGGNAGAGGTAGTANTGSGGGGGGGSAVTTGGAGGTGLVVVYWYT